MKTLNIKDPEAHRLAAAISRLTGESMTHAVTEALKERFERIKRRHGPKVNINELRTIAKSISGEVKRPYVDHNSLLYDEHGLPK